MWDIATLSCSWDTDLVSWKKAQTHWHDKGEKNKKVFFQILKRHLKQRKISRFKKIKMISLPSWKGYSSRMWVFLSRSVHVVVINLLSTEWHDFYMILNVIYLKLRDEIIYRKTLVETRVASSYFTKREMMFHFHNFRVAIWNNTNRF